MTPLAVPLAIAAVALVVLATVTWCQARREHARAVEARQRRLHAGATARDVEANARLRYWQSGASDIEVRQMVETIAHADARRNTRGMS